MQCARIHTRPPAFCEKLILVEKSIGLQSTCHSGQCGLCTIALVDELIIKSDWSICHHGSLVMHTIVKEHILPYY